MGRWIGIDYGTRRIGLACADRRGKIASPATTLSGTGAHAQDADRVLKWASENEADGLVVGLPLSMDGTDSQQTKLVRDFAAALTQRCDWPVELWDERLSSFQADQVLDSAEIRPARRRSLRDALAAQVILQSFLDARDQPDA